MDTFKKTNNPADKTHAEAQNRFSVHLTCLYTFSFSDKIDLREPFKYYFADFVRKEGGSTPQIRNPLFAEKNT